MSRLFSVCSRMLCLFELLVLCHSGRARQDSETQDPSAVCARCHREIYERYRQTPMANASGPAVDGFIAADFVHAPSGVHYRVFEEDGRVWLSYERDNNSPDRALKGRVELRYFLGSGKRGRTYLFEREGYWFESPINWYSKKQLWDMTPNFLPVREMPLTLPVDPGCLHCHASNVARSLPKARNLYLGEPFAHGGITCAACHGNGSAHVGSAGRVRMMNIDALQPVRRDSVCLSCHLEGQTAVIRKGKEAANFEPGDNIFDFALYFNYKSESGSGGRATSQWEALLRSQCKLKSGDRLTCTTCHDPHGSPAPEEKVAFYRQKCVACHSNAGFAEKHHPERPDCTQCHMARPPSNDVAHEQVTDHWIRKRVSNERLPAVSEGDLQAVGGVAADDRDLGLAYAQMAARGHQGAGTRALELLHSAENEPDARSDYALHAQLGFLEQMNGQPFAAGEEYRLALNANPFEPVAGGDLALLEAKQHKFADAVRLWRAVFEHDPTQPEAGMNLAIVECGMGDREAAMVALARVLEFSPDNGQARRLAREIQSDDRRCIAR